MPFLTGVMEGFQSRRDQEIERELAQDKDRRRQEGEIYKYLLESRNPEMQSLALAGLFESGQPGKRQRGMAGYLGKLQGGTIYPQVRALMDRYVPVEEPDRSVGGGPAPPVPGSAAQPANQPVRPGSEPIEIPAGPTGLQEPIPGTPEDFEAGMVGQPPPDPMAPQAQAGGPPPKPGMLATPQNPQVSRFKRLGTGVPTAEEIAEMSAAANVKGRFEQTANMLRAAGATEEEVQEAFLAMAGTPRPGRNLQQVSQWGVKVPGSDIVQPVLLDTTRGGGYVLPGGQPLPPGSQMVRMGGGAGGGGSVTSTIRDSPEVRAQYGIPADDVTPSGYWRIRQGADGHAMFVPAEYTPPPAYSGTTEILEPGTDVPVRAPVLRGGGTGPPLGDAPGQAESQEQVAARGLLEAVDADVKLQMASGIGKRLGVSPQERDRIVQRLSADKGLGYTTYGQLVAAAKTTPKVSPREARGGSAADRVLANLQRKAGRQAGQPPPAPALPAGRSRGAGPGPVQ